MSFVRSIHLYSLSIPHDLNQKKTSSLLSGTFWRRSVALPNWHYHRSDEDRHTSFTAAAAKLRMCRARRGNFASTGTLLLPLAAVPATHSTDAAATPNKNWGAHFFDASFSHSSQDHSCATLVSAWRGINGPPSLEGGGHDPNVSPCPRYALVAQCVM